MTLVAGVDFGTQSVRFSLFDSDRGRLGTGTASYPVHRRRDDPQFATQSHHDHLSALETAAGRAFAVAEVRGQDLAALAVDTTGSTVVPVGAGLVPLDDYYLWCDHRGWREAERITQVARDSGLEALRWCGGVYSAEFGWGKLWHWLRTHPDQRSRFVSAMEHCDLMVSVLCGIKEIDEVPRGICAMGHKWMWNESLGGLPDESFLSSVDPVLTCVRRQMSGRYARSDQIAGTLCAEWAARLGVRAGIPIPVGGLDAHWDAIGAGIRLGDVVNVIGTSTCVMAITERCEPIPGVSGVVAGSIHPSFTGIEAGLSAVGDIFDAIAKRANTSVADLFQAIEEHRSGQTGLLRLVWDNGDRNLLNNPHLRGATLGWHLGHTAADELFAAVEGTAFHTRIILERLREYGVPIDRVINTGGIPRRSLALNRVYANVLKTPVLVPEGDATGLGSAVFALVAAGAFPTVDEAQQALCLPHTLVEPDARSAPICDELFGLYHSLYGAFDQSNYPPQSMGHLFRRLQQLAGSEENPRQV